MSVLLGDYGLSTKQSGSNQTEHTNVIKHNKYYKDDILSALSNTHR